MRARYGESRIPGRGAGGDQGPMFEPPPPDPGIEIIVASQGISKGIRQTDGPQFLVRPTLAIGRATVGAYAKNITSPDAEGEAGLFVGYSARIGSVELSPTASYKRWLGTEGRPDAAAWEFGLSAARGFGAVTPRLGLYYTPDDLGGTGESLYVEAGAALRLSGAFSIGASLARRERTGGPDYAAFSLGATYMISRAIAAEVRLYDTDRSGLGAVYAPRLVASLRGRF